jgi:retron-type reverse transcriptase
MERVEERTTDQRVWKLIRLWLEAGVIEDGTVREKLAGTPQGGVISPLLANIYLNRLGRLWAARRRWLGVLIRYADDFRGDVPNGIAAQRSAPTDRAGDGPAGMEAASGEHAAGGLQAGQGGELRVS